MRVGDSVRLALGDWEIGELESSMLHACNALDGTAKKLHPNKGVRKRFEQTIRDNYTILGPWATPGLSLDSTFFPVRVGTGKKDRLDVASIVYLVHRCTHSHGDELPDGFAVTKRDDHVMLSIDTESGTVALPAGIIPGLLAVSVLSPANNDQDIPMIYHLWVDLVSDDGRRDRLWLPIHQWWGRRDEFHAIMARFPRSLGTLEFPAESFT